MSWRDSWKQLFANLLKIWPKETSMPVPVASLFSLSSQLVLLPQTKESIAPRTLCDHSKAFVCLQWPLKSHSQIPHSCFLSPSKKESLSDAKGRDQWGPGLMVTKRPEGWPSFQYHGLWVFQAMDKHYGLSVAKMVNLIKGVTLQHLTVFLRITPCLLKESHRQPTWIPRVSWSCCFVTAQRQWRSRRCCGLRILIWTPFKWVFQDNRREHSLGLRGWFVTSVQVFGVCSVCYLKTFLELGQRDEPDLTPSLLSFPSACCSLHA